MTATNRSIDTDALSARYRAQAIDLVNQRLLITNFRGTNQEKDFSVPANCGGFGRVHHFRRATSEGWPPNDLPLDPACRRLGLPPADMVRAQVFQNAVCNWRCWYCFVDFALLSANRKHSDWLSAAQLVDLYLAEPELAPMIDLSGGQPDLVPEWVPWMMEELQSRGLQHQVYLWSDDNLSNDYFWRYLNDRQRETIAGYPMYGRVCCFKGYNADSFAFNTKADPSLFERQFALMKRLLTTGIDLYAYVTFTAPSTTGLEDDMKRFVDRLQNLDEFLPLRTVPLEIKVFTPVTKRPVTGVEAAQENQWRAVEVWQRELAARFTRVDRERNIVDVPMKHGR